MKNWITIALTVIVSSLLYILGRKDSKIDSLKDQTKLQDKYSKVDVKDYSKDEIYKDKNW